MSTATTCPFCGFRTFVQYAILIHIEVQHSEERSPFVPDEGWAEEELGLAPGYTGAQRNSDDNRWPEYCECPVEDCSEIMTLADLQNHVDSHGVEQDSEDESLPSTDDLTSDSDYLQAPAEHTPSTSPGPAEAGFSNPGTSSSRHWSQRLIQQRSKQPQLKMAEEFQAKKIKRLGKKELGRYHKEERMPEWLFDLITKHNYKSSQGTIPVLSQFLQLSTKTHYAYLCNPAIQHISKLRNEGSFCGYRNIQMLISYIVGTGATGSAALGHEIPSIFQIQDMIENAWDSGIYPDGRIELGVLRQTRKYIGTPEASTLLQSLGIPWEYMGFKNREGDSLTASEVRLYDFVENYFASWPDVNKRNKVRNTNRSPLYFQHKGHSMTIIGVERTVKGTRNLLVFDPSHQDPRSVTKYVGRKVEHTHPDAVLKLYRRGARYLSSYQHFEVLQLK